MHDRRGQIHNTSRAVARYLHAPITSSFTGLFFKIFPSSSFNPAAQACFPFVLDGIRLESKQHQTRRRSDERPTKSNAYREPHITRRFRSLHHHHVIARGNDQMTRLFGLARECTHIGNGRVDEILTWDSFHTERE